MYYSPVWSPDGTQIAFVSARGRGRTHIYTMDTDGSNLPNIAPSITAAGRWAPMWSHDGTRIAFVGTEPDSSSQQHAGKLYVIGRDGTELTGLIELTGQPSVPAWSPDDSRIAILQTSKERPSALYTTALDGSSTTVLVDFVEVYRTIPKSVQWSPDGSKILVSGSARLIAVNSDGSEPIYLNIPSVVHGPLHASWSPDGSQIALNVEDPSPWLSGERHPVLSIMNADGTDGRILVHGGPVSRWSGFGKATNWELQPTYGKPWPEWLRGDPFPVVTPEPSPAQGSNSAQFHERESLATAVHIEPTVLNSEQGVPVRSPCHGPEEEPCSLRATSGFNLFELAPPGAAHGTIDVPSVDEVMEKDLSLRGFSSTSCVQRSCPQVIGALRLAGRRTDREPKGGCDQVPTLPEATMNYDNDVKEHPPWANNPVPDRPDCSPYPLDVMAIFALYQGVTNP